MEKFSLKLIKNVQGKQKFYKLIEDDFCPFDAFQAEIKNSNYLSGLMTIYAYMDMIANLKTLPNTKFRDITPVNLRLKNMKLNQNIYVFICFMKKVQGK